MEAKSVKRSKLATKETVFKKKHVKYKKTGEKCGENTVKLGELGKKRWTWEN